MTKTTTKKTTAKTTTSKASSAKSAAKATPKKTPTKKTQAKKTPRMSASAARVEGAARTKRALADAKAAVDANLKAIAADDQPVIAQDHEAPIAKAASEKKPRATKAATKRPSGLDLAAKVLADAGEPLAAKAIAERAIAAGWTTSGKTPHATLYAAIIREIASKGDAARFAKTDRGLFIAAGANAKKGA